MEYTGQRFQHGEELQRRFDYPGLSRRKCLHDDFREIVPELAGRARKEAASKTG